MGKRLRRVLLGLGISGLGVEGTRLALQDKSEEQPVQPEGTASHQRDASTHKPEGTASHQRDASTHATRPDAGSADTKVGPFDKERLRAANQRLLDFFKAAQIRAGIEKLDDPSIKPSIGTAESLNIGSSPHVEWDLGREDSAELERVMAKWPDLVSEVDSQGIFVLVYVKQGGKKGRLLFKMSAREDGLFLVEMMLNDKGDNSYYTFSPMMVISDFDQLDGLIPLMRDEFNAFYGAE